MMRTMLYQPASRSLTAGGEELLDAWRQDPDARLWLDLHGEDADAERRLLVEGFGLHPLAVSDAQRLRHPPKFEAFHGHAFILLKGLGADGERFAFETIQIAMFIGDRLLVTRHSGPSPSIDRLWTETLQDPAHLSTGPDALAMRLSRISVDRYLKRLLMLEPRLEQLEDEIVDRPRDEILAELMGYKTTLRKFRRLFAYHVQLFQELLDTRPAQIRAERVHEINDVFEHQERAGSLATLYFETASDLIDGYISLASHRLNNIVKVLTIVTTIFVPLSFLAGVYGMNFEYMPELKSHDAYFILLGVMSSLAVALLLVFRRMRWL